MPIVNSTNVPDTILRLVPADFYLGGSRRMAELQQQKDPHFIKCPKIAIDKFTTDYDFYATMDSNIVNTLLNNGFEISKSSYGYLDDEAVVVLCNNNIQVVMRLDAKFYCQVFENIEPWFFYQYLWKSSPVMLEYSQISDIRAIMNMLFAIGRASNYQKRWY